MKHTRLVVTHYGGPEALQVREEEAPSRRGVKCEASHAHELLGKSGVTGKIVLVL